MKNIFWKSAEHFVTALAGLGFTLAGSRIVLTTVTNAPLFVLPGMPFLAVGGVVLYRTNRALIARIMLVTLVAKLDKTRVKRSDTVMLELAFESWLNLSSVRVELVAEGFLPVRQRGMRRGRSRGAATIITEPVTQRYSLGQVKCLGRSSR